MVMRKKHIFINSILFLALIFNCIPVKGQPTSSQYSRVLIYTARISDTTGLSESDIVKIVKEKGSIEEVYVKEGGDLSNTSQRYLVESGEVGIGYPGFYCLSDKKLIEFKANGRLKHQTGQDKAFASFKKGDTDIGIEWRFQRGLDIANEVRCTLNGNLLAKTDIKRHSNSKYARLPYMIRTERVNKPGQLVQIFEYIEEDEFKRKLKVKVLSKKPVSSKFKIKSLGDKKSGEFETLSEVTTNDIMSDLVEFSGCLTGLSYSYDTGWQPAGFPLQMRVAFGAGADISSRIEGEFILDTLNNSLTLGSAYSELAMDFGAEFSAQGSVNLWLWDPFVFDIPIPYFRNFDFRINNRSYYNSYLLDSYAVVSDTTETQTIVNVDVIDLVLAGGIPIPGLGGGINIDCALSGRAEMTGTGISLTDGSYFTQEQQSETVSISSYGYHETAYYDEDLVATCTLVTYPTFFIDFAIWHWEIPIITIPWDIVSLPFDLNLSSSGVDFSITIPDAPTLEEPDDGETVYGSNVSFVWTQSSRATEYYLDIALDNNFSSLVYSNNVGNITEINISGFPDNGTKLYWRVKAGNATGWSHYSDISYFYSGESLEKPNPPTLRSPTNGSFVEGQSIEFEWQASERADNYYLELSRDSSFSTILFNAEVGNTTRMPLSGFLNDGTRYFWHVRAGNSSGWSDYSADWSFNNGTQLPPVATSLVSPANGSNVGGGDIEFRWNPSVGALNYHLQLSISENFDAGSIVYENDSLGNITEILLMGFPDNGARFYWRVRCQNFVGWSGFSSIWHFDNGSIPIPSCPQLISPSNGADIAGYTIEFAWEPSENATNYWFEIATDADFNNLLHSSNIGNYTNITASGFPDDGTEFYWRVSAGNVNGFGDCHQNWYFINGQPIQLRLISPNGGELWKRYTEKLIAWDTNISGTVKIELYLNGVLELVITDSTENTGSFIWDIPSTLSEHFLYTVRIVSNDNPSITDESDYYFTIVGESTEVFDGFETGDFSKYLWHSSVAYPWIVTSDEYYSGGYSTRSGIVSDDETSFMRLNKNVPNGKISFYRKISSEFKYDRLAFFIDEQLIGLWSGERDWSRKEYYVKEGPHSFMWMYLKDYSISEGNDCGWIDDVKFEEEPISCHLYAWADFHGYEYRTHNMQLTPGHFFAYNWYYEDNWLIYYDGGGFTATFDYPHDTNMVLSITHLTSASSRCPGNGYSPVTIKVNDVNVVSGYDPAENHDGTHGYVTDELEIPVQSGTNLIEITSGDLCTNYWIQSLEIRDRKILKSDINCNGTVDFYDFCLLADRWMEGCAPPNWCSGNDFNEDRQINFKEVDVMAEEWLKFTD